MARKLNDWVAGFEALTEWSGTPLRLRRWAAIACIAGVLERKTWVHTAGSDLYPNIYCFLIAPPGIGKSHILSSVRMFWSSLADHKLAASNVSKASLIDELNDSLRVLIQPGKQPPTIEFHSLKVLSSELGVFLPEFANDFMNTLTDLYDGYPFKERKRSMKHAIEIDKPQLNLLAATTPSYLTNLLPEGAWDQGFLSRTILVYGVDRRLTSLFTASKIDRSLEKALMSDLETISELYGEMSFTPEAADFIDSWYLSGQQPVPSHPKLQHYNTRRTAHILKLCQVACANESNVLEITKEHVQRAMDWLFDAETAIPEIFKAMYSGGDAKVMEEAWHMLFQYKARTGKGAPRALLIEFLSRRVPSHNVERLIDLMEKANTIRQEAIKGEGMVFFAKERTNFQ